MVPDTDTSPVLVGQVPVGVVPVGVGVGEVVLVGVGLGVADLVGLGVGEAVVRVGLGVGVLVLAALLAILKRGSRETSRSARSSAGGASRKSIA